MFQIWRKTEITRFFADFFFLWVTHDPIDIGSDGNDIYYQISFSFPVLSRRVSQRDIKNARGALFLQETFPKQFLKTFPSLCELSLKFGTNDYSVMII